RLDRFIVEKASDAEVLQTLAEAAAVAKIDASDRPRLLAQLHAWIAQDAKITPLKTLQGLIWAQGYSRGELHGHIYADAVRALERWRKAGLDIFVYSSGSIAAQQLIFGYSEAGDLRRLFSGFFDTTVGPKLARESYERIAKEIDVAPSDMVFFSDNALELDAAASAGMQTVQLVRVQDHTVASPSHANASSLENIDVEPAK
nr:acireductone synthase [Candidatus Eremiobacteraeota bacterium]